MTLPLTLHVMSFKNNRIINNKYEVNFEMTLNMTSIVKDKVMRIGPFEVEQLLFKIFFC